MTPERLQQIEDLYHSVREASAEQRVALLTGADPDLRREVESLLARQNDHLMLDRTASFTEDPTVTLLNAGVRLGPYQVESKLGEGGMGEIFRAVDTRLGRPVAIKLVHERFNARFEREARAISSLNHPHVCTLYDIGPNYLVMELLEGETLAARLKNGPLPEAEAVRYALQIAGALAAAHERGIVHRDLKPGNIMLVKSGVKVLDFGLATWEGDETLTGKNMVLGTPAYMAPEQRAGQPADARTDLYSFGRVFYEMLTGSRATAERIAVPSQRLEQIVSRCLEEDPARRWQSAKELASALEAPPPAEKKRSWSVPAAAVAAALLLGAGYYFVFFHPAPKLTDQDIIVLADFVNSTGDPIFDGTLRQGLASQLEQSPFLKIMDDEQVQRVLQRMTLPAGARVTNPVAHEICVREGAAATIDGTIASLGKSYVVTLQAITCQGGTTLAREQVQAEDKEHVLNAVGTAATAMRAKLGESRNSIQKLNRPLEEATTRSFEALQNYSAGFSQLLQGQFLPAVPLLERAKDLDPDFAMAYHSLSIAFENAGDMTRSREQAKLAFGLIDRVSEFERDYITPRYFQATGEWDKAIDAYQLAIRNYPRFWGFHNYLSMVHLDLGQYEEGLKAGLEAARLQANVEHPYRRQLDAYIGLDLLPEAKRVAEKLRTQALDGARIHQRFLEMAYVEDDPAATARETQWFAGKPEEYISFGLQAAYRNLHGQRRESHKLYQQAEEAARRRGLQNVERYAEADAGADALAGNCQASRRLGRPALALALCGDVAQAEKLAAETSQLFPNGTIWNAVELPGIRAAIALFREQPAKSIELLASAAPYERAFPDAIYLRGLAFLRLRQGVLAVAEFRKVVEHKGANWVMRNHPPGQFYALSYLGMARGYALAGDTAKAKRTLQDFLEMWKDADPDLPILQQAKADYARLQ